MKKLAYIFVVFILIAGCTSTPAKYKTLDDGLYAEIETEKGDILVELFVNEVPMTVASFVSLAEGTNTHVSDSFKGVKYYDGLTFHRVLPDFVIHGGCPDGTGAGGPGYSIDCELAGGNQFHDKGVLSMAHAGRNTGGSQFFICHSRNNTSHLDRNHTCFGKVIEGLEVIEAVAGGDKINSIEIVEA